MFRLQRAREGNFGDYKSVGDGVSEMRLNMAGGYRLYYTFKNNRLIIMLAGGDKSSQQDDIKKAQKLRKELFNDAENPPL